jgi:hypothetical protein
VLAITGAVFRLPVVGDKAAHTGVSDQDHITATAAV